MTQSNFTEEDLTQKPIDYEFLDRIMTQSERAGFIAALHRVVNLPSMDKLTIEERIEILNLYKQ